MTQEVQAKNVRDYYQRVLESTGVEWGKFYYDAAVSAGRTPFAERPEGRLLFHSVRPGDHVVMTRLDRCFRSVLDGVSVMQQLEQRGVFFHSLDYNIDTRTPLGRYVRNILLAGAELERDLARERANETIAYLRKEGLQWNKSIPMGWKVVIRNEKKHLRVCHDERAFIDKLAEGRKEGATVEQLALFCWHNEDSIKQRRRFDNYDAIRWALQARRLGYPKTIGAKQVARVYREMLRSGQIKPY